VDSCWYHVLASQMAEGRGVHVYLGERVMPPSPQPGYVSLLSCVYNCTGPRVWVGSLISAISFLGTAFVMGSLVRRRFGIECALVTAAVVAWCYPIRTVSASIMSDPLGALLCALLLAWMGWSHSPRRREEPPSLLLGCLCGMAVLVRIVNGILVPTVALTILYSSRRPLRNLVLFVVGGLPFLGLLLSWNWIAFGHPLRTSYQVYSGLYHPEYQLFSPRYALPNLQGEGIQKLLGHFLFLPYVLLSGGSFAGEGLFPVLLLAIPSLPYWLAKKRFHLFLPLAACCLFYWLLLSFYLYASQRMLVPAFLALLILGQPALKRLLEGMQGIPRIGPLLPAIVVLGLLAPAMERGARESVSLKWHEGDQWGLCQWIDENTESDAIIVSGWQILMETYANRTSIPFWEALDEKGAPCPLLRSGRPVYVQLDWYSRNLWGDQVLEALKRNAEGETVCAPQGEFLKMRFGVLEERSVQGRVGTTL